MSVVYSCEPELYVAKAYLIDTHVVASHLRTYIYTYSLNNSRCVRVCRTRAHTLQ